jgi:phosphoribosylformylglycinamidine cyclo-ligase
MAAGKLTYQDAGVDIDAADRLVSRIGKLADSTKTPEVLSGVGLFAAAIKLPRGYREPVLMTATDGVGTKLALACIAGRHDTIGIDLVAMNVNDVLTSGARPLCFLDYLSVGRLASVDAEAVISGIAEGCRRAGASLVGGETAEMPGFYDDGKYDLAGFTVGIVERKRMLTGARIRPGQAVIGLASSGLHSNGYSLARRALGLDSRDAVAALASKWPALGKDPTGTLLEPTTIYVKPVLAALDRFDIKGMAHITGGGIPGNLIRILPTGTRAVIDRGGLPRPAVFEVIRDAGNIDQDEMDRTFNCGIGFAIVVPRAEAADLRSFFRRRRIEAEIIGTIEKGRRSVRYVDGA